ncbi:alpha/beta hydrolase [Sneathiella limimaris]|uniref:alpha/beta hydrolase n=1 Tax=Sneathiella limimaris TaxID=1964213 RepID=UPI00146ABDCD|nr:alpha/beta hydrolase [Sneathiella limimaris]
MSASDAYWQRKMSGQLLELDGRQFKPRAQALMNLQEMFAVPPQNWTVRNMRGAYRKSVALFDGPKPAVREVRDITLELKGRNLKGRVYDNRPIEDYKPALLFFHGGGFVIGDLETHDGVCRRIARYTGAKVISVAYRLAPEHPFPSGLDDALDSWVWLQEQAENLKVDPTQLYVAGDSAGAVLSLLVTATASKGKIGVQPAATGLIYPADLMVQTSPTRDMLANENIVLTKEILDWFQNQFATDELNENHEYVRALSEAQKGNIGPVWIMTCGFDPLRHEGEGLITKLQALGAEVQHKEYQDLYHGFIGAAALFPEVDEMAEDFAAFLAPLKEKAKKAS